MNKIEQSDRLMNTFQDIQGKFGKSKIAIGAVNKTSQAWQMNRSRLSDNPFALSSLIKVN